ncbi:MAG TPA: hypothetical protein VFQ39_17935 [Longimicrobium sp.]|nr:hypothetical protein [Longimicrobium sp.]
MTAWTWLYWPTLLAVTIGFAWIAGTGAIGRWRGLALIAAAAAVLGYTRYRFECAQPLTCDVGGSEAAWYYFSHLFPQRAALHAAALVLAAVMTRYHRRSHPGRRRAVAIASAFGTLLLSWVIVVFVASLYVEFR